MKKLQIIEPGFIFEPQTTSIDFNGVDEEMANVGPNTIGVADVWSLMLWINRDSTSTGQTSQLSIFDIGGVTGPNIIRVESRGNEVQNPLTVILTRPTGVVFKNYRYQSPAAGKFPYDEWRQVIVIWDGTTLSAYDNGVNVDASASKVTDITGTMTDTARSVFIATRGTGQLNWIGLVHSVALWDVDVTSAVTEIYNDGVASTFNLRDASFAANLQHWWRLGQDSTDLGKDSARTSAPIDVNVDSANITSADIVSESPA